MTESATPNALATTGQEATGIQLGKLSEIFDSPQRIFTSLDTSTKLGRAMTMVYMQNTGSALQLTDHLEKPISVQDFIVHSVQFTDKDGVEVQTDRIVLICPNGTAYAAVSGGVRRSLQQLMVMFGVPPYKPAVIIKAVGVKTRGGFRAVTLVPVIEALKAQLVESEQPKATSKK